MKTSERIFNEVLVMEYMIKHDNRKVLKYNDLYYSRSSLAKAMETKLNAAIRFEENGK